MSSNFAWIPTFSKCKNIFRKKKGTRLGSSYAEGTAANLLSWLTWRWHCKASGWKLEGSREGLWGFVFVSKVACCCGVSSELFKCACYVTMFFWLWQLKLSVSVHSVLIKPHSAQSILTWKWTMSPVTFNSERDFFFFFFFRHFGRKTPFIYPNY